MTMQDQTAVPGEEQELPPDEQASGEEAPPPQPSEREIELERRLRRQGNELANSRRALETLSGQMSAANERLEQLTAGFTQAQRAEAQRQASQTQAYLESLPPEQRTREELRLANQRIAALETRGTRQDAPPARTSTPRESEEQYQARRSKEILQEAADTFSVPITREEIDAIPAEAWEDEQTFKVAVMRMAAGKAREGNDMAKKPAAKPQTNEDMADGVRQRVLKDLGVSTPATPRAAGVRKGAATTGADVRGAVQSYDSRSGPKANIERMKKLRANLPEPK